MTDITSMQRHVAELVSDAKVAMLTTTTSDGRTASRPASTVAFAVQTVRAAVTRNPNRDAIANDTVER